MMEAATTPSSEKDEHADLESRQAERRMRVWVGIGVATLVLLFIGVGFTVVAMIRHPAQTEIIRDIVIIFMAVEFLIIGLALILLIYQVARLTDLLRNEIKPILDSTKDTVGTLQGTTRFLSDHLVQPVVKVNSSFAAIRRAIDLIRIRRSDER